MLNLLVHHVTSRLWKVKVGFEFLAQLIACRFLEKSFALWSTMTLLTDAEECHKFDVTVEGAGYIFLEISALLNNMFCWCVSLTVDSWRLTIRVSVSKGHIFTYFSWSCFRLPLAMTMWKDTGQCPATAFTQLSRRTWLKCEITSQLHLKCTYETWS